MRWTRTRRLQATRLRRQIKKELPIRAAYVMCMPVRDEADEIIGTMLAHLLDRAGYRTRFLDIGSTVAMFARVSEEKQHIVCLSALPPFAVGRARMLYGRLRAQSPDLKIVIGLCGERSELRVRCDRKLGHQRTDDRVCFEPTIDREGGGCLSAGSRFESCAAHQIHRRRL
jgi:hypothetical protein